MAAHAYRHGKSESHVDRDRSHLNQVLHGPATFEAARAAIDALPDKQPNGRKIRTDANYTAQVVCTFPKELPEAQLETWARETVKWAEHDAPGKLLYAVMHRDEGRPHIHMGIAALEPDGKLNYRALFGRESLDDRGENLLAMQKSLAERISHLGVEATQGNDYEDTGPNAWRILKAREEGRAEKAAELVPELDTVKTQLAQQAEQHRQLQASLKSARTARDTEKQDRENTEAKLEQAKTKHAEQLQQQQARHTEQLQEYQTSVEAWKTAAEQKAVEEIGILEAERGKEYTALATTHNDLIKTHNGLVARFNNLLNQTKFWREVVDFFTKKKVEDPVHEAEITLMVGMNELGHEEFTAPAAQEPQEKSGNEGPEAAP